MANAPKNPPVSQRQRATKEYQREKSVNLAENKLFAFVCSVVSCTLCGDVSVYGMFVMSAFRICNSSLVALFFLLHTSSTAAILSPSITIELTVQCASGARPRHSHACMHCRSVGRPVAIWPVPLQLHYTIQVNHRGLGGRRCDNRP